MGPLDLPEKIKVLKARNLKIPIIRCQSEPFDPEKPSLFDKSIESETVDANSVINCLLGIIKMQSKAILLREGTICPNTWKLLKNTKELLERSKNSVK